MLDFPRPRPARHGETVRWVPPYRYEVRVCPRVGAWEVRHGAYGEALRHADEAAALREAIELARQAFADHDLLSCVKVLRDGTWEVVEVFGVSPDLACERRHRVAA